MSKFRRLLALLVIITIPVFVGANRCSLFGGEELPPVTLEVWGVFDDEQTLKPFINEFQDLYPNIQVVYTQRSVDTYETDILNEFAAGRGPDVWMVHNTWLPKHQDKIRPFTAEELPVNVYQNIFADIAVSDLTANGQVYAIPAYIDSMALIYNRDILQSAGYANPPSTWLEFDGMIKNITRYDNIGNITRSGAALGTAQNVNRAADMISLLMLQTGVTMTNDAKTQALFSETDRTVSPERNRGVEALTFFTNYANPSKSSFTWDLSQDNSIDAFIAGKTAMIFNYSYALGVIKERAPRLNVSVAEMPQLDETGGARITFANYWALAMAQNTDAANEANMFIQFLAGNNAEALGQAQDGSPLGQEVNKRYLETFQRPSARRDLIETQQQTDANLGPFAKQNLVARTWYIVDDASYESIFNDMIDDVILGRLTIADSLKKASDRYTQILKDTLDNRERAGLNGNI
ncbi:ABC transporter substrate-binding protein [Patescibacteria group bacterium]